MINKFDDYLTRFNKSNIWDIFQAYKKPSQAKINAFFNIRERNENLNICAIDKIIGYNCDYFTLATYIPAIDTIIIDTYANTYVYNKKYGKISWDILFDMIENYNVNR